MKPNCVIFRIPPFEDGTPQFVELNIEDGHVAQSGRTFGVKAGDSYLEMKMSQVVLAHKETPDAPGSTDLEWATVFDPDDNEADIYEMSHYDLDKAVLAVMKESKLH